MWVVMKKYHGSSCICQDRNEQWIKHLFHQNVSCDEKVSWLKLCLPRQKWTMNKTFISSKCELWWKSIMAQAVFAKTEMNNEWNIYFIKMWSVMKMYHGSSCICQDRNEQWIKHLFHQNVSCDEKVSWLKLCLPRQKWTMNKTFISSKCELWWKSIMAQAVFAKTEMNNE